MARTSRDMWRDREATLRSLAADRRVDRLEKAAEAAFALELMEDDAYGFCTICGLPIPELRLETAPETTRCDACRRHTDQARAG